MSGGGSADSLMQQTTSDSACVTIRDLHFAYGPRAFSLRLPSLDVRRGERVVIVGPSGSGKSTLLQLLAGVLAPDAGEVIVHGVNLAHQSAAQRRSFRIRHFGLVFQEFELLEHLTVRENVQLPFYINPALKLTRKDREFAAELVTSMGITDGLDRRPRSLSHGERQRVAIARALVTRPSILLADEPTGNLDPDNTRQTLGLLLEEAARNSATVFMVTHDHSVLSFFDRVIDFKDLLERP